MLLPAEDPGVGPWPDGGGRGRAYGAAVRTGATTISETAATPHARALGWLQRRSTFARDAVLAGLLAVLTLSLHAGLEQPGAALVELPGWVAVAILLVICGSVAWRRRAPGPAMGVAGMLTAAYYFTGNTTPAAVVALSFSLYGVAAYEEHRRDGVASLLASWFFMTLSFLVEGGLEAVFTVAYALIAFVFLVAWALGDATRTRVALSDELRRRNAQLEVLRERERDQLVTDERRRIARELHDVVSHTVSVVIVQASAARRVADRDPAAVTTALEAIEGAARTAMGELRSMLGVLRDDGEGDATEPAPDLTATAALLGQLVEAGMPLRLHGELPDRLPAGVALAVHRIVQEALTNVLRHADDVRAVDVTIERAEGAVVVEVVDDGRPAGFTDGAGAGLVGMRERAALHGGSVEAEPLPGRGFRVRARLPVEVAA